MVYQRMYTSYNLPEFSLFLASMCDIGLKYPPMVRFLEDNKTLCKLKDTGITGMPTDTDIVLFMPKKYFPLEKDTYSELETRLKPMNLVLSDEPEKVVYTPKFNYVLRKKGTKEVYEKGVLKELDRIGYIRPNDKGSEVHFVLNYENLKTRRHEKTQKIFEAVIETMLLDEAQCKSY